LPGIGSYLGLAIAQANIESVLYAILTMLIVIFIYDQLFFRPLLQWSKNLLWIKLNQKNSARPWVTVLLQRAHVLKHFSRFLSHLGDF